MDSQSRSSRLQVGNSLIRGPLQAFGHGQFRIFWVASLLSIMSFMMTMIARGWLVLQMTDSPFMVTAVQAVFMSPMMVLPLIGGAIADRVSRRLLALTADAANGLMFLLLALLLFSGVIQVWHIFALALLNGVANSLSMPGRVTIIPDVLPQEQAANGMALFSTVFSISQFLGPAAAGYIMAANPDQLAWPFLAASILLLLAVGLLSVLRLPSKHAAAPPGPRLSVFASITEGLAYVRGRGLLVGLLLFGLVLTMLGMSYQTLLPVVARDILHTGPEGLGMLAAAGGLGAIAGSLTVALFSASRQMNVLMVGGSLGFGVVVIGFALSAVLPVSLVLAGTIGFAMQTAITSNFALLQEASPDSVRGRVMGLRFLVAGLGPIALFLVGTGAETLGTSTALVLMGIVSFSLISAVVLGVPAMRRIEAELRGDEPARQVVG